MQTDLRPEPRPGIPCDDWARILRLPADTREAVGRTSAAVHRSRERLEATARLLGPPTYWPATDEVLYTVHPMPGEPDRVPVPGRSRSQR
jgi:hypothetical protein